MRTSNIMGQFIAKIYNFFNTIGDFLLQMLILFGSYSMNQGWEILVMLNTRYYYVSVMYEGLFPKYTINNLITSNATSPCDQAEPL